MIGCRPCGMSALSGKLMIVVHTGQKL
jgi:hypothetical protein